MTTAASEKSIQNEIFREFGTRPWCRLWRSNSGVAKYRDRFGKQRSVRFGVPGQPDISGIIRGGVWLGIEVKSATGTQSVEQRAFQLIIERFGGIYILARSVEDVRVRLAPYLDGAP